MFCYFELGNYQFLKRISVNGHVHS